MKIGAAMRYWMASAGNLSGLTIRAFALLATGFYDEHNARLKFDARLHGHKVQ